MKGLFSILMTLAITMLLFSCRSKLTREKAQELIVQKIKLPEDLLHYLAIDKESTKASGEIILSRGYGPENDYEQKGLLEKYTYPGWIGESDKFTQEGKKYLGTNIINANGSDLSENNYRYWTKKNYDGGYNYQVVGVKVAKIKFGEVTGLLENNESDKNNIKVDYSLIVTDVTPFGQSIGLNKDPVINFSAYFVKYDDGWRIDNIK